MYAKYHTDALVLGSIERGEADRFYTLYTKELGLVKARASAVRRESSRMRYALMHYATASISLVRGTRGWRVAGATARGGDWGTPTGLAAFARVVQLVIRLVPEEEKNESLFSILTEARRAFAQESCDNGATIELLCVARTLHALGYLSVESVSVALFSSTVFALPDMAEAEARREALLLSVNRALSETQL